MMTHLNLSANDILTTTRAVRKRLDFSRPVDSVLIKECLEIALQAPSGSNSQGWHFVLVTDKEKKQAIAKWYQKSFEAYEAGPIQPTKIHTDDPSMKATQEKVLSSAKYLADNLADIPAMLIPCFAGRLETGEASHQQIASIYGSILPAVWSFMLAARDRGIGTCWTTLHLAYEKEVGELLGIPPEFSQAALIPIAYSKGTQFNAAPRKPLTDVLHTNNW